MPNLSILALKTGIEDWEQTLTYEQLQATAFDRGLMHGELLILQNIEDENIVSAYQLAILQLFTELQTLAAKY